MVDIHMKHLLRFYRNYPLCESGLSYVDSKLATDFVGLSRTDLRKFMGSTYASFDDIPSDYTENTFDLSLDAKDVLLPPGLLIYLFIYLFYNTYSFFLLLIDFF